MNELTKKQVSDILKEREVLVNQLATVNFVLKIYPTDANFIFNQSIPSTDWRITHNLDKFCSVEVVSSSNIIKYGNVTYIDSNSLKITFSAPFSGRAYLN